MQRMGHFKAEANGLEKFRAFQLIAAMTSLVANIYFCIVVFIVGDNNTIAATFLVFSFIIGSVYFSQMINAKSVRPILFMTLLYWNYALVLPAIYQSRTNTYFWSSSAISEQAIELSAILIFVSTLCMLFASQIRIRSKSTTKFIRLNRKHDKSSLIISLAILTYALALIGVFGWESYFLPRELAERAFYMQSGGSSIVTAMGITAPKAAAISILAISLYNVSVRRQSSVNIATIMFSIFSNLIVNFPLASPRYFLVSIAFVVMGTVGLRLFQSKKNYIYIIAPLLIYFIFPFLGQWNRGDGLASGVSSTSVAEYMSHGDMDGFQSIMNAISYVEDNGISLGKQIISSSLFFIPRSLWEGKSENSGSIAAEAAGYHYLNISMPLPGEFYMDFGFIGAAFGMAIFGLMINKGDELFKNIYLRENPNIIYAVIVASFVPIILRGPFLSTVQALCVALVVTGVWRTIARIRVSVHN